VALHDRHGPHCYYANLQIEPEVLQDDGEKRIEVIRKPLGVVAAITPWNFPVILSGSSTRGRAG
jgi:acyl-CoA reductase-like NAD-dependent aldehyde dehydrogenase